MMLRANPSCNPSTAIAQRFRPHGRPAICQCSSNRARSPDATLPWKRVLSEFIQEGSRHESPENPNPTAAASFPITIDPSNRETGHKSHPRSFVSTNRPTLRHGTAPDSLTDPIPSCPASGRPNCNHFQKQMSSCLVTVASRRDKYDPAGCYPSFPLTVSYPPKTSHSLLVLPSMLRAPRETPPGIRLKPWL